MKEELKRETESGVIKGGGEESTNQRGKKIGAGGEGAGS